ncbi:MAG: hypothetical protein JKY99_01050, partial [Rhizobiales bacterium]|nr:hypothetical protein [Hyphomicrobiales bacterium]
PAIEPQSIVKAAEPTQVISPEIIVAPAIEAGEQLAPDVVLGTAAEITGPVVASPRSAPEPTVTSTTVQLPKTPAEIPPAPMQQPVTTVEPTSAQPIPQSQQESAASAYSNLDEQGILANLEDALKIDIPPNEAVQQSQRIQPAATRASERHQHDQDLEQNHLSSRQKVDLSAGFAAAMAGDAAEQLREPQGPTISDTFLEDALAEALEVNTDTYSNEKNTVYSSSESVPTGSEGSSALRRTSHVDDEMNRLLDELATPSRG